MKHTILLVIITLISLRTFASKRQSTADSVRADVVNTSQQTVNKLSLYPEFGSGNVIFIYPVTVNASIVLKDESGKIVKKVKLKESTNNTTINCKELLPGTYSATLKSGLKARTATLIIEE